jgi:hypothetical protein
VKQQENNPAVIQKNNRGSNQQGNVLFGNQSKTGKQPTTGTAKTPNKNGAQPVKEEEKKKQQ